MVIGSLRMELQIPDSHSLKEKRMVLRSLLTRVRHQFSVAAAEVGDQDLWQAAAIGIACVSSEARHADEICQKVLHYVERDANALLVQSHFELIHV